MGIIIAAIGSFLTTFLILTNIDVGGMLKVILIAILVGIIWGVIGGLLQSSIDR